MNPVSGVISGSGGGKISKTGAGTLFMSNAANTHDKKITVSEGTLRIEASRNLGEDPGGVYANKLTLNGGELKLTANVTLNTNYSITIGASHGEIDLAGGWIITGGDIQFTNNANLGTANNDIQLDGGTLYMQDVAAGVNPVVLNSGRTITLGAGDVWKVAQAVSGLVKTA